MKKIILITLLAISLYGTTVKVGDATLRLGTPIVEETHNYPLSCVVSGVDLDNDIVGAVDFNGNLWEFEGVEDWQEGDIVAFIMNDNGTEEIFDDVIVDLKYCGWVY